MMTLSIRQPWAWLVVSGTKDVENRTWTTQYRGWLLIHAGQHTATGWRNGLRGYFSRRAYDAGDERFPWRAFYDMVEECRALGERRGILGMAHLLDIQEKGSPAPSAWHESDCFGWMFDRAFRFPFPVRWRGKQRLFEVPQSLSWAAHRAGVVCQTCQGEGIVGANSPCPICDGEIVAPMAVCEDKGWVLPATTTDNG